ncbi:excisionase [Butyrivibrio sp. WCD2001]|uniref:excisionase n=1 Tax=Butyrivibrio sp. WCD2001 TaxID=1280681 RepID=UPI0003F5A11C|nr:excisionase [Butyrivibrio sp. WCD2001]
MKTRINKTIRIQLGLDNIERVDKKERSKPDTLNVPIWHKTSMTVEEASEYSNIGINRIRELCKDPLNKP